MFDEYHFWIDINLHKTHLRAYWVCLRIKYNQSEITANLICSSVYIHAGHRWECVHERLAKGFD